MASVMAYASRAAGAARRRGTGLPSLSTCRGFATTGCAMPRPTSPFSRLVGHRHRDTSTRRASRYTLPQEVPDYSLPLLDDFVSWVHAGLPGYTNGGDSDTRLDVAAPMVAAPAASESSLTPPAALARCHTLLLQHQLGQHVAMVRAMVALGLDPERCVSVDIPYTSHDIVQAQLASPVAAGGVGIPPHNVLRHTYTLAQPYGAYQRGRVASVLDEVATRILSEAREAGDDSVQNLVVVDDGAYVIEAMAHLPPASAALSPRLRVWCVEQTQRGIIKILASDAMRGVPATVVDVARSATKKIVEAPVIGEGVTRLLYAIIEHEAPEVQHLCGVPVNVGGHGVGPRGGKAVTPKALVIGYGAVGRQVALALRDLVRDLHAAAGAGGDEAATAMQLDVAEIVPELRALAEADGFACVDLPSHKGDRGGGGGGGGGYTLVVGCTGVRSFTLADVSVLAPRAVLASASSGNHELSFDECVARVVQDDDDGVGAGDNKGVVVTCLTPSELHEHDIHRSVEFEVTVPGHCSDGTGMYSTPRTGTGALPRTGRAGDDSIALDGDNSDDGGGAVMRRRLRHLNGGLPTTFLGRLHAAPAHKIAPTLALMVAGAQQAAVMAGVARDRPDVLDVVPLDPQVDRWISEAAARHDDEVVLR